MRLLTHLDEPTWLTISTSSILFQSNTNRGLIETRRGPSTSKAWSQKFLRSQLIIYLKIYIYIYTHTLYTWKNMYVSMLYDWPYVIFSYITIYLHPNNFFFSFFFIHSSKSVKTWFSILPFRQRIFPFYSNILKPLKTKNIASPSPTPPPSLSLSLPQNK